MKSHYPYNNAVALSHQDRGLTALHYSAEAGDAENMMLLMAFHALVDIRDYVRILFFT